MAKIIKIYGDANKGCIFFEGSTVEPKFLGTVFCDINANDNTRLTIKRNDRTTRSGQYRTIFRKLRPSRVQNVDGEFLVGDLGYSVTDVCDYINEQANVTSSPVSGIQFVIGDSIDFIRDETNTSILFSNGDHHGVNAVRATVKDNGLVGIFPKRGDTELYEIDFSKITVNGTAYNSAQNTVNALNALFTVTANPAPISVPHYVMDGGTEIEWMTGPR